MRKDIYKRLDEANVMNRALLARCEELERQLRIMTRKHITQRNLAEWRGVLLKDERTKVKRLQTFKVVK